MTHVFTPLPGQTERWKKQARASAVALKKVSFDKEVVKIGWAFDDGVVTLEMSAKLIRDTPVEDLGEAIYQQVLMVAQEGGRA